MVKLYHATPYPTDTFRVINPGTRNVAVKETPEGPVAEGVSYDESNPPYVYAGDNSQLATTYAITKGIRLGNMSLSGGEILFVDKESIIGDPKLKGGLFSFESDRFMPLWINGQITRQWVSPDPVDLTKADFSPIRSLNDIMETGVQVYQIAEETDYNAYQLYLDMRDAEIEAQLEAIIADGARSGALRWLNAERGINPVHVFGQDAPETALKVGSTPALAPIP